MLRPPRTVIVDFNTVCNARCVFCCHSLPWVQTRHWSFEDITVTLDSLWSTSQYNNIGGDGELSCLPFFEEVLDYFDSKPGRICFSTNGYQLNPTTLRKRRLHELVISLHSLTPAIYDELTGTTDRLATVLDNTRAMARKPRRYRMVIAAVVTHLNASEAVALAQFALEIEADEMRFLPLADAESVQLGEYKPHIIPDDSDLTYIQEANNLMACSGRQIRKRAMTTEERDATVCRSMAQCENPASQIVITLEGDIQPCCFIPPSCNLGNIFEKPWQELWEGPRYQQFRAEVAAGQSQWCRRYCRNWG